MKRLITCTDGTWDSPGEKQDGKSIDSNVCLFYTAVKETASDGIRQLKVYDTGVGTGREPGDKLIGGVSGAGLDKKIKDVYTFLVMNYEPGDEIYLVGFSRGAYTARSLAGFIRNSGILRHEHIGLIDKAFDLYRDRNEYTQPESDLMISFRRNYCVEDVTRIKFIGVWDTVGALGIPLNAFNDLNNKMYSFHDVTLSSTVDHAFHALAVDERRKPFKATLWQKSSNSKHGSTTTLEQRWFAGVHCDVGGGYPEQGLSNDALHWMAEKAQQTGLDMDQGELATHERNPLGTIHNSFTWVYWLSGKIRREICNLPDSNQCVDPTVYQRMQDKKLGYNPPNVPANKACP